MTRKDKKVVIMLIIIVILLFILSCNTYKVIKQPYDPLKLRDCNEIYEQLLTNITDGKRYEIV